MLNYREFVDENYSWHAGISRELHESGYYDGRRAVDSLLDELYEHYYESELSGDPEWIKIVFDEPETFPRNNQQVTYFFKIFGNTHDGEYDEGTFFSKSGFCDCHDAPYWKPR